MALGFRLHFILHALSQIAHRIQQCGAHLKDPQVQQGVRKENIIS